jgi:8-oxo-dGTP pyrophosphatase MutT (NUDIX family)
VRELREETGLEAEIELGLGVTEYVYSLTEEPAERRALHDPSVMAVHVDCFRVEAPNDWEPTLDAEHDDHRWSSPDEARRVLRWPATANALDQMLSGTSMAE